MPDDNVVTVDAVERRKGILAVFRDHEFARIHDLSKSFGVSEVTIRSDVDVLVSEAGLRRVRGGVMRTSAFFAENRYEERTAVFDIEKRAIGVEAASLISSSDSVILDGGTTTMEVARALMARTDMENVTVFTGSLNIALALEPAIPRIEVVVLGGTLRPMQHSLVEPMATLLLERLQATIAFIGCNGIDPVRGVLTTNLPEMAMKQHMLRASKRHVLVADASKLTQQALARVCGAGAFDTLVTAGDCDPDVLDLLRETGVEIRVATVKSSVRAESGSDRMSAAVKSRAP